MGIKFVLDTQIFGSMLGDCELSYMSWGTDSFVFKLGESTAIKVALDTSNPNFYNEQTLLRSLQHPNIIKIYGSPAKLGFNVTCLECMGQNTLFEYIIGSPNPQDLQKIFLQIICGLIYLELYLIVHYDLKPENILLNSQGIAKIADFGSAVRFDSIAQQKPIRNTGTANYANPLTFFGGKGRVRRDYISTRNEADIYPLGMILFMMATGEIPYETLDQQFDQDRKKKNLPPKDFRQLSPNLQYAVSACCLFKGNQRTGTISLEDLKARCTENPDMFVKTLSC